MKNSSWEEEGERRRRETDENELESGNFEIYFSTGAV